MNSPAFQVRLRIEEAIMASETPQFNLHRNNGELFFQGWINSSNRDISYQLKLVIPEHFPDQMPRLYITSPITLPMYKNDGYVNSKEGSHDFHTNRKGPDGCIQICHFSSSYWDASKTCIAVLTKGVLWLHAYDWHLLNGKTINDNLLEIKRRQQQCLSTEHMNTLLNIDYRHTRSLRSEL